MRDASQTVVFGTTSSEVGFRYDADGLLVSTGPSSSVDSAPVMTLTRNSSTSGVANNGLLTGVTVGSVADARTYNTYGELSSYSASLGSTALYTVNYEATPRDGLGRIVKKSETVAGSPTTTVGYVYDTAGRLWKVTDGSGATKVEYTYDNAQNGARTAVKTYGTPGDESTATTTSATYDGQDRLKTYGSKTYAFRASGELSSITDGTSTTTYSYDNRGNLLQVVLPGTATMTIDYVVDPAGRRVGKKVDGSLVRRWLYDGKLRVVGEIDDAGTLTQYVYATRPNVPEYAVRGGSVYRVLTDQLGSVRLVVNASDGTIAQQMEYDADLTP